MAKFFKVTATGLDGIRKDVYRVKKSLQKPIEQGLSLMADEMTTILQRHIHDDWFADRWQPVQYIRRTNGEGVGLGDRSNMKPVVKDSTLFYEYSPTTDHYVSDWDDHNPDLMIYRIENNELWKFPPTDRHGEEGEVIPIRSITIFTAEEFLTERVKTSFTVFSGRLSATNSASTLFFSVTAIITPSQMSFIIIKLFLPLPQQ